MGTLQEALVKARFAKVIPIKPDLLCETQVKQDYDEVIADVKRSLYGTIRPKFVPRRERRGKVKVVYMSKDVKMEQSLQYQIIVVLLQYPNGLTLTEIAGLLKRRSGSVSACLSVMKRIQFVSVTGVLKRYMWRLNEWVPGPGLTALDIHKAALESTRLIKRMRRDIPDTQPRQAPSIEAIEHTKPDSRVERLDIVISGGITVTLKIA